MAGIMLLVILLVLYFVPSLVAWGREHHQVAAIVALNLLLGWTFVGWVIALVWALTATPGPAEEGS
jgi:Superinfection immunity protein